MHELKFEHIELYVAKDVQIDCKNRMCVLDCGPCPCRACWPVLAVPCVLAGRAAPCVLAVSCELAVPAPCVLAVPCKLAVPMPCVLAGVGHAVRAGRAVPPCVGREG